MRRAQVCRQRAVWGPGAGTFFPGPAGQACQRSASYTSSAASRISTGGRSRVRRAVSRLMAILAGAFQTWLMLRGFPIENAGNGLGVEHAYAGVVRLGQAHQQVGLDFVGALHRETGTRAARSSAASCFDGRRGDAPVLGDVKGVDFCSTASGSTRTFWVAVAMGMLVARASQRLTEKSNVGISAATLSMAAYGGLLRCLRRPVQAS